MNIYNLTYNDVPAAISLLFQRIDALESILKQLRTSEKEKEILNIDEAAALLRRKKSTLYIYASAGKIPCVKSEGKLLFSRKDLMRWLDTSKRKTVKDEVTERMQSK
ncbi:MAG: helix-turn-helix domain-containing protein [Bacteroidetes bacterium]|nr:helix-turn-helix domain-containing protein [Bacteroidota bacterium]